MLSNIDQLITRANTDKERHLKHRNSLETEVSDTSRVIMVEINWQKYLKVFERINAYTNNIEYLLLIAFVFLFYN